MAAGAYVMNDITGPTKHLIFNVSYAYHLNISRDLKMNFGIAWSYMQTKLDVSELNMIHPDDEVILTNTDGNAWKPDANAGLMIHNTNYYFGLSCMQLFQSKYNLFKDVDSGGVIYSKRHYYFTGGARFYPSTVSEFHPYFTAHALKNNPFKIELGMRYTYGKKLFTGLSYSHSDALVFTAGYKYKNITFGYSYDIVVSRIRTVSSGAHEVTLAYDIPDKGKHKRYRPMYN